MARDYVDDGLLLVAVVWSPAGCRGFPGTAIVAECYESSGVLLLSRSGIGALAVCLGRPRVAECYCYSGVE